jgi:8-amino-7-oxononanoate synthase
VKFAHNDPADLERLLIAERSAARHALVATDGVFSMDGDIAPLDVLSDLCQRHDAWLLSDDAHGVGVLAGGRGSGALFPNAEIPLQMGTLSKALGSYGGYVCGSQAVIDLLKTRARTLVYATGLPPASAAAALAALDLIEADPVMTEIPVAKARLFTQRLALPEASSPIVPVILGSAESALAASARLEAQGFLVVAIRPPTVPEGMARLRIAFSAAHDDDDVIRLADAIVALLGGVS